MVEGVKEIADIAVNFYKGLLGDSTVLRQCDLSSLVKYRLEDEAAERLASPVSSEEIKKAIFSISNDKSPGPDGYSAEFFKDSWELIGNEVCTAVSSFFEKSYMPPFVNSIALALIQRLKMLMTSRNSGLYLAVMSCIKLHLKSYLIG
ncbi:Transposon TX1 uncharacterized 149 kDa protein [Linum perenne]